jgi:hypothetical protein
MGNEVEILSPLLLFTHSEAFVRLFSKLGCEPVAFSSEGIQPGLGHYLPRQGQDEVSGNQFVHLLVHIAS